MEKLELKSKKINTHNMRKMFPIYKKHKAMFAVTMTLMIISGIAGILRPIFSANALASLAVGNFDAAIRYTLIMCGISLFKIVINCVEEYCYVKLVLKMQ